MNIHRVLPLVAALFVPPAFAQFPVNVLQDCWTTNQEINPYVELEGYEFTPNDSVSFIWKHKVMEPCSNYVATIFGFECRVGKPKPQGVKFSFRDIQFGRIDPDPVFPERLFEFVTVPGGIPPGRYDWLLVVECNDSGNGIPIGPDGEIDDECGVNLGTPPANPIGVVIFGPEPTEVLDPDPGGFPPGRGSGEEGTTRPWCFEVLPSDSG